ncbi:hypothetical protein D7X25_14735 [bacterium 1XD42-8]|jgi:hypothetical protein|nr:hypothetical protein [Lachnospiraceae bacterium]RKJ52525.1 hypothetical protein D7X25_14735 [bacterium 1XD42-8]
MSYDSCIEADHYFKKLIENKESIEKAWDFISRTINEGLSCENLDLLISLIPYIEEGDGTLAFQYIGESRRILQALHIIKLERKYEKIPFSIHCNTMEELMEKYLLTLFALRRLQFQPSESAVSDAVYFLSQNKLSVFAIYTITQRDLIIPDSVLYEEILRIYTKVWTTADKEMFLSFTKTK